MFNQLVSILLLSIFSVAPISTEKLPVGDNYEVKDKSRISTGYEYEVKCTDCGKYITIYYKNSTKKYAQGDSPWYSQYSSFDSAASKGCNSKCD